jgi:hypothetical protein
MTLLLVQNMYKRPKRSAAIFFGCPVIPEDSAGIHAASSIF